MTALGPLGFQFPPNEPGKVLGWGGSRATYLKNYSVLRSPLEGEPPFNPPDPMLVVMLGASNAWGNELADTGSKTVVGDWQAWNSDVGAFGTPALGSNPFRPVSGLIRSDSTPYTAPNNWGFQLCNILSANVRQLYFALSAKPSTNFLQWTDRDFGGVDSSANNFDSGTSAGTIPKFQDIMDDVLASDEITRARITQAHLILVDLGGIDTLVGQDEIVDRIQNLIASLRAQSWCASNTPIIAADMPPRGSYGDVSQALNRVYASASDKFFGLVNLEGISFTIDDYPATGDTGHYAGSDMATVAQRALDMYYRLPVSNLGNVKNAGAGLGVILSTAASDGTVPGESRAVPYVASCTDDGTVYTLSTPATTREVSYIEVSATNAPRNVRTTFHNYRSDGAVLRLMAPRKPAINITNISVGAGPNYFVTVTYTGTIDDSDPDYRAHVYISGVGGAAQVNGRYFEIVSLDTTAKTFVLQNSAGVYTNGNGWGAYTSGGTVEEIIAFEDPRNRNRFADEVDIFENESVTYERLGGGATAPFRVVAFTQHPDFQTYQDPYRPNNPVLNGDFRMMATGWSNSTRSEYNWTIGDADSGRFPGSRAMVLKDRTSPSVANNLIWAYRRRVQEGDQIFARCWVKAENTVSPASSLAIDACRLYFQYFDIDGVQVGSDVAGVSDTSARADWTALEHYDEVPANAVEVTTYLRCSMTGGTVSVTDFELGIVDNIIDGLQYATRAAFVTAVAGGLVRANGLVTYAGGLAYKWQSGATAISDLPGLVPADQITALHFGADPTGVADSYAAIQGMLNAYPGRRCYLPKGKYLTSDTIWIKYDGQWLCGESVGAYTFSNATDNDNGTTIVWGGASGGKAVQFYRVNGTDFPWSISGGGICDILIYCIGASNTAGTGLYIPDANNSVFERIAIHGPSSRGLDITGFVPDRASSINSLYQCAFRNLMIWAGANADGIFSDETGNVGGGDHPAFCKFENVHITYLDGTAIWMKEADDLSFDTIGISRRAGGTGDAIELLNNGVGDAPQGLHFRCLNVTQVDGTAPLITVQSACRAIKFELAGIDKEITVTVASGAEDEVSVEYLGSNVTAHTGYHASLPIRFPNYNRSDTRLLDWYQEGFFTPTLLFGGANTGMTGTFSGRYTRIGNRVFYDINITLTAKGSATGTATLGALPFTSASYVGASQAAWFQTLAAGVASVFATVGASGTTISLSKLAAGAAASMADTDFNATSALRITGSYEAA